MRICITGGIACGKSLVGRFMSEHGIPVRDADDICHELIEPDGMLYDRIISAFGREIVRADGRIDRRVLAGLALGCPQKREELNAIIHPKAKEEIEAWINMATGRSATTQKKPGFVAAIIPLVFEVGWEDAWERVICVSAPAAMQIARLMKRGWSEKEAEAWINTQMPVKEKMRRADHVIFNSGSPECAGKQTLELFGDMEQ